MDNPSGAALMVGTLTRAASGWREPSLSLTSSMNMYSYWASAAITAIFPLQIDTMVCAVAWSAGRGVLSLEAPLSWGSLCVPSFFFLRSPDPALGW